MGTIHTFGFFKFDIKSTGIDRLSSGNDGITTVMSLTEGKYGWSGFEWRSKFNTDPIFHHVVNSTDS
jgi:hypothetical protein